MAYFENHVRPNGISCLKRVLIIKLIAYYLVFVRVQQENRRTWHKGRKFRELKRMQVLVAMRAAPNHPATYENGPESGWLSILALRLLL
jgi:hypothetical protein